MQGSQSLCTSGTQCYGLYIVLWAIYSALGHSAMGLTSTLLSSVLLALVGTVPENIDL